MHGLPSRDAEKYDLSNWRVGLGGAKLNRQLAERAWELGIFTQSAYGMTETCPGHDPGTTEA
jgi:fatty-acyl-CoA synthase